MLAKRITLGAAVGLLALAGLLPLAVMAAKSVQVDGQWSLALYRDLLRSARAPALAANSLALAGWTTMLATALGVPLGILLGRTDLPWRKAFAGLLTIPLLLPPYITAVAWFDVLGRRGQLSRVFGEAVSEWTSLQLFGLPGCVLVLSTAFCPLIVLLTIAWLGTVNPRLEDAARLVASWPATLRVVTLPLVWPGIALAASLVFLLSLGEFGVPIFLRFDVFPVESFTQFSAFFNHGAATAAAVPLLLAALLLLVLEWNLLKNQPKALRFGSWDRRDRIPLGKYRQPAAILTGAFVLLLAGVPYAGLAVTAGSGQAYREALARAGDSLVRSMLYAAAGASILTAVGFFAGYLVHTRSLPVWRAVDALMLFLFAVPSTVLGIGLVLVWNQPWSTLIYGTPVILFLGYTAQYAALTSRATVATLSQIPQSMEDAAQVCGAGWHRRILVIVAPLASRGLLAGWLVAYIFCLRDVGISMIVYPPGHDTLPVRTFTLMANGAPDLIAALCMLMIAAAVVPVAVSGVLKGGLGGRIG
ncbi:MAG: iron ABC transporter permease [Acidobacteria bacterium]|nr:iron ABC transporter permease [Acidobacteriota bacterium]